MCWAVNISVQFSSVQGEKRRNGNRTGTRDAVGVLTRKATNVGNPALVGRKQHTKACCAEDKTDSGIQKPSRSLPPLHRTSSPKPILTDRLTSRILGRKIGRQIFGIQGPDVLAGNLNNGSALVWRDIQLFLSSGLARKTTWIQRFLMRFICLTYTRITVTCFDWFHVWVSFS